ncbi:hypothetical protein FQN54_002403 [Arachnomyces sp. PD_36]|nr:hypothetical protein FQN54_002403 [Arachnomyces sp. PD_36]
MGESFDREDAAFLSSVDRSHGDHHHRSDSDTNMGSGSFEYVARNTATTEKIRFRLMVVLLLMVLALETGGIMSMGPGTRIFESIACRNYYLLHDPAKIGASGQVNEDLCKINDVQAEVAAIVGYKQFFDGLLSASLAIPYGLLTDRVGRKRSICLNIPGFFLNLVIILITLCFPDAFPLRTLWLASLAWFIGGGPVVVFANLWTMMTDMTAEEERASVFFNIGVAMFAAQFIASLMSSWLMTSNPWIPMLIGFSIIMLGLLLALSLPETIPARVSQSKEQPTVELANLSPEDNGHMDSSFHANSREKPLPFPKNQSSFEDTYSRCRRYLSPYTFIFRNKGILLLLTAFFLYRLGCGSDWFLVQYISTRYSWTLAQATFLSSFKAALSIPLFLYVIPSMSRYLLRSMKADAKDLRLAGISVLFLIIGTFGIAQASSVRVLIPSLVLQTFGSGFVFLVRSLITTLVEKEETARLFTAIEILQTGGNVLASLTITRVFQRGLEIGGSWIGLAWTTASVLFGMVGVAIWLFKLPPVRRAGE